MLLNCNDCCGATACGQVCVTVKVCGAHVGSGYVVQLKSGSTVISSCTTDATGACCLDFYVDGTYTIAVTPPAGSPYSATTASTGAITCSGAPYSKTVNLSTPAGYHCFSGGCSMCNGSAVAESLTLSVATGTVTLTYDVVYDTWRGCHTPTISNACSAVSTPGCPANYDYSAATAAVPISYELQCLGTYWQLNQYLYATNGVTGCTPVYSGTFINTGSCDSSTFMINPTTCGVPLPTLKGASTTLTGTCADGALTLSGSFGSSSGTLSGHDVPNPDAGSVGVSG